MLRACLRQRYGTTAPSIWIPPASPPRGNWITKERARAIVDLADTPHIKLFMTLGLATRGEGRGHPRFDMEPRGLRPRYHRFSPTGAHTDEQAPNRGGAKNGRARNALSEAHSARLTDHVVEYGGKPVASVKKAIQRLSARAGIPISPHTVRHTCAVWMAQDNVPVQLIS